MKNGMCTFVGLAVALSCGASLAQRVSNTPVDMEFVTIRPGSFQMGCSAGDKQCLDSEKPAHQVQITKPFEIGKYEVTREQWRSVMTPEIKGVVGGGEYSVTPITEVSWHDVEDFMSRMNARKDGYHYRLPSEAEWEYAARAGSSGAFPKDWKATSWYGNIRGGRAHPVGRKKPNAWGIYDMLGNVSEWIQDWYSEKYDLSGTQDNPTGPLTGQRRAVRGGSWGSKAQNARVSHRGHGKPDDRSHNWGFRCVRVRIDEAEGKSRD